MCMYADECLPWLLVVVTYAIKPFVVTDAHIKHLQQPWHSLEAWTYCKLKTRKQQGDACTSKAA